MPQGLCQKELFFGKEELLPVTEKATDNIDSYSSMEGFLFRSFPSPLLLRGQKKRQTVHLWISVNRES